MNSSRPFRVVIDTNIFISGLAFGGNPGKIIDFVRKNKFQTVTSPEIELEIFTKLAQLKVPEEKIQNLKIIFDQGALRVIPKKKVLICRDQEDNMFLEVCLEAKADFLITGDKDLLVLKNFGSTKILNPKDFLKIVKKS